MANHMRRRMTERRDLTDGSAGQASKKRAGRPSRYTQEIADEICRRLADGEGLKEICRTPGMPSEAAVRSWALNDYQDFAAPYEQARQIQFHRWADEILSIADDSRQDISLRQLPDGTTARVVDHEHINRSRLKIDSRKWLLSKLLPSKFGDRVATELTGAGGRAIRIENVLAPLADLTTDELILLQQILRRRAGIESEEADNAADAR
jgi:hypothetical protein